MNWNRGHSPPFQGGVAARLQEMAPFLDWRSRGGSYPAHNHPGRSLGSRPPLLSKEGNALDSNSFATPTVEIQNSGRGQAKPINSLSGARHDPRRSSPWEWLSPPGGVSLPPPP